MTDEQAVNKANFAIKQLIERFCEDLATTISETAPNALYCVNIEQIRGVLTELGYIDIDTYHDNEIIEEYLKEQGFLTKDQK